MANNDTDVPRHQDEEWLREKYHGEELSMREMGELVGKTSGAIGYWMDKHDIDTRTRGEATRYINSNEYAALKMTPGGWEAWRDYAFDSAQVAVHQLLAISEGADPEKVFSSGDWEVHHRSGIEWDNRPENVVLLSKKAHLIATMARECEPEEIEMALESVGFNAEVETHG